MNHQSDPLTRVLFIVPTLIVVGLITATPLSAQTFTLNRTFDDPTVTIEDRFGSSVALDGNRALIGAPFDATYAADGGEVHLFSTTTGNLLRTFHDPIVNEGDRFGSSVALDGNRVLIGAPFDDTSGVGGVGQAHLFDAMTGNLSHTFDDPTVTFGDGFGRSVAVDEEYVLIGAPWDDTRGFNEGQAHLFDLVGNLMQTFDVNDANNFGLSVALDGERVLIGSNGQAYLFNLAGDLLQTFDDPTGPVDRFGHAVALDGNLVLIGDPFDNTNGLNVGQAHLFDTSGNWLRTFDDPTVTDADRFGSSVALEADHILIGARGDSTHGSYVGQAHLFDATTSDLLQTFDDPTVTDGDGFGSSVALEGNRILISAPWDSTHGSMVGQAYLFTLSCDFNADGLTDIVDIDALIMEIVAGTNDPAFDLDGDRLVNVADRDEWLAQAGALNRVSGNPYLVADFNLDGVVDGLDFIEWNANKFSDTGKWSLGDANADGITDGVDFIEWNANKFMPSDTASAVPEPGSISVCLLAMIALVHCRRSLKKSDVL